MAGAVCPACGCIVLRVSGSPGGSPTRTRHPLAPAPGHPLRGARTRSGWRVLRVERSAAIRPASTRHRGDPLRGASTRTASHPLRGRGAPGGPDLDSRARPASTRPAYPGAGRSAPGGPLSHREHAGRCGPLWRVLAPVPRATRSHPGAPATAAPEHPHREHPGAGHRVPRSTRTRHPLAPAPGGPLWAVVGRPAPGATTAPPASTRAVVGRCGGCSHPGRVSTPERVLRGAGGGWPGCSGVPRVENDNGPGAGAPGPLWAAVGRGAQMTAAMSPRRHAGTVHHRGECSPPVDRGDVGPAASDDTEGPSTAGYRTRTAPRGTGCPNVRGHPLSRGTMHRGHPGRCRPARGPRAPTGCSPTTDP